MSTGACEAKAPTIRALHEISLSSGEGRRADLLVRKASGLLKNLPAVPLPEYAERVALDLAVINSLGQSNHHETFQGHARAAIIISPIQGPLITSYSLEIVVVSGR